MLQSSANLTRSQRNLQWVKSKFKSLKSNLHEASLQVKPTPGTSTVKMST
jgi:hypothetical protein